MAFVVNSFPFGSLLTSAKMTSMQNNDDALANSYVAGDAIIKPLAQIQNLATISLEDQKGESVAGTDMTQWVWVDSSYYGEYLQTYRAQVGTNPSITCTFQGVTPATGVGSVLVNSCGWCAVVMGGATGGSATFESVTLTIACTSSFTYP